MTDTRSNPARSRSKVLILPRWAGEDGLAAIMSTSLPLMLSFAVASANLFLDRIFLSWYSKDSFAAALQAGMLHWTIINIFFQTVGYTATFIAQYLGADDEKDVGSMFWQGVYLSLMGGVSMAALGLLSYPFFRWIGHEGQIPVLEAQYFEMLCRGSVAFLLFNATSSFFAGQNRMKMVLGLNILCFYLNAVFNSWVVFSKYWILPTGLKGSALSTISANAFTFLIAMVIILADPKNESRFHIRSAWHISIDHMKRLLKFGLPAGLHVTIDLIGFTTFLMVVGVFGYRSQFASNMAMNINLLLFIPAVGLHVGTQILSGQFCGAKRHESAERMTAGSLYLAVIYMILVGLLYILGPALLLHSFRGGMSDAEWTPVYNLAKLLLIFVAFYSIFDAIALVYSGALKGAGDTKFVMLVSVLFSQLLLTGPCIVLWRIHKSLNPTQGLYMGWAFCSVYVIFMATVNFLRFRAGRWKSINMLTG